MTVLLVKSCELVKIIVADTIATFDRVKLLTSCAKVEALHEKGQYVPMPIPKSGKWMQISPLY